jgi:cell division protein ZapA (FtsZ GTPase activity inhibitor)
MSDPKSGLVQIKIYDREYAIRTSGDPAQLRELCGMLDRRMRELAESSGVVDTLKVAILAALSASEELRRVQEELKKIDEAVGRRSAAASSILDRIL